MKKVFLIFGLLVTIVLTGLAVYAKSNYLHSITLERNNNSYNVILNSDDIVKINRKKVTDNELILELTGITSADTVNALYKGTNDIDNLIIENVSSNKLKIYIKAPNISNSSILSVPENGNSVLAGENFPVSKAVWVTFALIIFGIIIKRSKKKIIQDNNILIKKDIKDREIELYRRYRKNFEEESLNSNKNMKMRAILKKIDRRIDERLMSLNK